MPQETPLPRTDGPSQLPPTATVNEAPDDPARTVDRVDAGTRLAASELPPESLGRFALAGEIGRGGMGCVLRGHDPDLDRDLAIKILLPAHRGHAELERRFLEEARIAGRLEHPGVPPVHELGRAEDGRPFFAMKLIRGQTLAELLREQTVGPASSRPETTAGWKPAPQDLPRFLAVFEQVCQTLAYAHAHGVIHRDLKPANVMVGKYGEVQVMDWGLAKVLDEASRERKRPEDGPTAATGTFFPGSPGLSQAGSVLGTPAYMPPEQARGQIDKLDERADVFGLGAILCEVLTGSPPFSRGETSVLIRRSARGEVGEAFSRLDGCGADSELVALARDCLAAEACDRPCHAGEVAQRVTAYRAGVERRLREAEVERAAAQARAEEAKAKVQAEKRARRLTLGLALAAMLLVAVGGGGFAWWWTQRSAMVHDVEMALADARTQMDQGRWPEGRAALERASGRLGDGGPKELRDRVRQARVDVSLVGELEEIRLRQATVKDGHFDNAAGEPLYAEAFGRYGLNLAALEEAEAHLRRSAVREALLAALQDWAAIARDAELRHRLNRLLEQADDDDWRRRFRAIWARKDATGLKALARQEETLQQPATILMLLGKTLQSAGLPDEAVRLLRRALRRHPGDFWINQNLGMALVGKDKEESVRFFSVALALRPDSPGTHLNLGSALSEQGKVDEAVACYRQAVALEPKYAQAHHGLGRALSKQGKLDEAVACYRQAIKLDPKYALAHHNLGSALEKQGKLDEAVACYRQAIELDPNDAVAHNNLGIALRKQDRVDEAIASYRQAVKLDPKVAIYHYNLGHTLSEQGKLDEAIACYRQTIARDPNYAEAHCNLGLRLRDQGRLSESLESLRRGHALGSKRPGWPYPSAQWVRETERQLAQEKKLLAFRKGEYKPTDSTVRIALAGVCNAKKLYRAAAGLYADAFAADSQLADDTIAGHRYNAACCAALAGCGKDADAAKLGDKEKARLRGQAMSWLRADLALRGKQMDSGKPADRAAVQAIMQHWQNDSDLVGVRDKETLAKLPEQEREEWQKLWADMEALRKKAEEKAGKK
jgi:tetratricopeptide (TPR) repeat protein